MDEGDKNSPLTTKTEPEWISFIGLDQNVEFKTEIDNDGQIKMEPSFAGEEEIDIDSKTPEDSRECINEKLEKLQNNDLTSINFPPIKEEGSKDCIYETKQNNDLQPSAFHSSKKKLR
uniref:Uncharacterized protein n=1 Tax=Timema douglasi TaxID=61478 RepID=A0A7R8ZDN8_TIMDO|nr:unnamed protein product [Timema douglasi]